MDKRGALNLHVAALDRSPFSIGCESIIKTGLWEIFLFFIHLMFFSHESLNVIKEQPGSDPFSRIAV